MRCHGQRLGVIPVVEPELSRSVSISKAMSDGEPNVLGGSRGHGRVGGSRGHGRVGRRGRGATNGCRSTYLPWAQVDTDDGEHAAAPARSDGIFSRSSRRSSFGHGLGLPDAAASAAASPMVLLVGPSGAGKGAAVVACGRAAGLEPLEVHCGEVRSRRALLDRVGEAVRSRRLAGGGSRGKGGSGSRGGVEGLVGSRMAVNKCRKESSLNGRQASTERDGDESVVAG